MYYSSPIAQLRNDTALVIPTNSKEGGRSTFPSPSTPSAVLVLDTYTSRICALERRLEALKAEFVQRDSEFRDGVKKVATTTTTTRPNNRTKKKENKRSHPSLSELQRDVASRDQIIFELKSCRNNNSSNSALLLPRFGTTPTIRESGGRSNANRGVCNDLTVRVILHSYDDGNVNSTQYNNNNNNRSATREFLIDFSDTYGNGNSHPQQQQVYDFFEVVEQKLFSPSLLSSLSSSGIYAIVGYCGGIMNGDNGDAEAATLLHILPEEMLVQRHMSQIDALREFPPIAQAIMRCRNNNNLNNKSNVNKSMNSPIPVCELFVVRRRDLPAEAVL
eukprot:PhM_4_TR11881/c0_g1_i1/m.95134